MKALYHPARHHDATPSVRERSGVSRYAGHRTAEHAQLRHPDRRRGGLQVIDDRVCRIPIDLVDEQRPDHRNRVKALLLRHVHLRIGHRPDLVDDRCRKRTERSDRGLAGLRRTRVDHQRHDHDPADVLVGGHLQRHRRRAHIPSHGGRRRVNRAPGYRRMPTPERGSKRRCTVGFGVAGYARRRGSRHAGKARPSSYAGGPRRCAQHRARSSSSKLVRSHLKRGSAASLRHLPVYAADPTWASSPRRSPIAVSSIGT